MASQFTTFLYFFPQIWDDPPYGPFPNENHQVSFQQQHAYGLKSILIGRWFLKPWHNYCAFKRWSRWICKPAVKGGGGSLWWLLRLEWICSSFPVFFFSFKSWIIVVGTLFPNPWLTCCVMWRLLRSAVWTNLLAICNYFFLTFFDFNLYQYDILIHIDLLRWW